MGGMRTERLPDNDCQYLSKAVCLVNTSNTRVPCPDAYHHLLFRQTMTVIREGFLTLLFADSLHECSTSNMCQKYLQGIANTRLVINEL